MEQNYLDEKELSVTWSPTHSGYDVEVVALWEIDGKYAVIPANAEVRKIGDPYEIDFTGEWINYSETKWFDTEKEAYEYYNEL